MAFRIANAAGFLGDSIDAPRRTVEATEVDYLTLEYLAELTLSILARQREKDSSQGYASDFIDVVRSLCPAIYLQPQLKIVTNAGGMNPPSCAAAAGQVLAENGSGDRPIGVVTGDDILDRLEELFAAGCDLAHLDTGQPLKELKKPIVCANAYLGARPIVDALAADARMVITGRVADASLTVGPAMHEFRWAWDDWNRLAGATVAGHLIECGAQVTGGYVTGGYVVAPVPDATTNMATPHGPASAPDVTPWEFQDLAHIGYPIAELGDDASATITKPPGAGGIVSRRTVVEQLLYEIGDPQHYLTPDVDVDFTSIHVEDQGNDRVRVTGASGLPATDSYKVSIAYHDGFTASGQLLVYGRDCMDKARACAEIVFERLRTAGCRLDQTHVELLGAGDAMPGLHQPPPDLREVVLRLAVRDRRREAVERFTKELAPLVTSGPAGLAGYATGRSPVRPVFAYWPALLPKEAVAPRVEVRKAKEWK